MKRVDLKAGALTAPIPPAIVTVGEGDKANMLTVAWTGILATVPPRTYISVRPSRHSHGLLLEYGEFVINLPTVELAKKVDYVGIYTGAKVDKFEKCGLTKMKSKIVGAPTVGECPVALECRVVDRIPMGSHDVFVADILSGSVREELVDREGKLHFELADLLAYAHGEYYALGERVGRFGFSTDKEKKARPVSREEKTSGTKEMTSGEKKAPKEERKKPFYEGLSASVRRKNGSKGRSKKSK